MHYLIYMSTANDVIDKSCLKEILDNARKNNMNANITGVLLYQDGTFIQLLEGPEEQLDALYAKIKRDPRHTCSNEPIKGQCKERLFPSWSMGFNRIKDSKYLPKLKDFVNVIDSIATDHDVDEINNLIGFIFSYSGWE